MTGILVFSLLPALFLLDFMKVIDLAGRVWRIPVLLLFPHIILLTALSDFSLPGVPGASIANFAGKTGIILFTFIFWPAAISFRFAVAKAENSAQRSFTAARF